MAKLIFSQSWDGLVKQFANWNEGATTNPIYYSIAFTDDGYLATHGKRFKLTNADGGAGEGGALSLVGNKLTFTDSLGVGHDVTLPLIEAKGVDGNPISVSTANSVATIQMNPIDGLAASTTVGAATSTQVTIPQLAFDNYGRVTAGQNLTAINVDKVTQTAVTGEGNVFYLLGRASGIADSTSLADTIYQKDVKFDGTALVAPNFKEGTDLLVDKYVRLSEVFQKNSSGNYQYLADSSHQGVVTLSDATDSTSNASSGIAATPYAVNQAITISKTYSDSLFSANDAMIFAGTISADGSLASKNAILSILATNIADVTGKAGWTFKFEGSGKITINGVEHAYEAGDMLVCTSDDKKISQGGWTIVQANIDGAVTAANAFSGTGLIVSTGAGRSVSAFAYPTSGTKILKADSSGLTWADDIDTHRAVKIGSTVICASDDVTTPLNFIAGDGVSVTGVVNSGTITIANTSPLSAALALSFLDNQGTSIGTYNPYDTAASFKAGTGLQMTLADGNVVINHSNSITPQTTAKLGAIKYDAQGHITGFTEVTSLKNPNALTISSGSSSMSYDGSTTGKLVISGSGDLSIAPTLTGNELTLTASVSHKYKTFTYKNTSDTTTTTISNNIATGLNFVAGNNITFSGDANSNALTISAVNTWRNVTARLLDATTPTEVLNTSVGTADLAFGDEFVWNAAANNTAGEIKLVWAEIDANGNITYQA